MNQSPRPKQQQGHRSSTNSKTLSQVNSTWWVYLDGSKSHEATEKEIKEWTVSRLISCLGSL